MIPTTANHSKHLGSVLGSIAQQTVPVDRVVVSASGISSESCSVLNDSINQQYPNIPIQLECESKEAYAAANRNRGAGHCTESLVSFMDVDDLMSPTRIERLKEIFHETNADAVYHGYEGNNSTGVRYSADDMRVRNNNQKDRNGPFIFDNGTKLHHGHPTVRRKVYLDTEQNKTELYRRGEDSEYARRLCNDGYNIVFQDEPLSVYRQHLSTEK